MKSLNIFIKLFIFIAFFVALTFDVQNLAGKGMGFRAPLFVGVLFVLPAVSKLKKWKKYPHMADIFITLPFLLDTVGNYLGLFNSFTYFDDLLHLLNWAFFIIAFHLLNPNKCKSYLFSFLLGAGLGALLIVVWELLEWLVSIDGLGAVSDLQLSYEDTIGDLFLSTAGGILGSAIGTAKNKNKHCPS